MIIPPLYNIDCLQDSDVKLRALVFASLKSACCTLLQLLSDFQQLNIQRPYRDAQNKSAWRDRTWATHT